jgi:hypothetical protein
LAMPHVLWGVVVANISRLCVCACVCVRVCVWVCAHTHACVRAFG